MAYHVGDVELVCPRCRVELEERRAGEALVCHGCEAAYPIVAGIPDLRVFPDPYITIRGDHIKGEMLASKFAGYTLAELLQLYFDVTPEVPEPDVRLNISRVLGGVARAELALDALQESSDRVGDAARGGAWLDVGCGSAPLVAALARRGKMVVGVDIAFRWLVIGKKRLEELGLRAPLVAACGEALPFRETSFDRVVFQSSLEVMADAQAALTEAFRVASGGARVLVSTPNRWSLGPDPHIGLYGGGYLPQALVDLVARLRAGRPPHRHLLSRNRLRRLLHDAGWENVIIEVPGITRGQREQFTGLSRILADTYEQWRQTPVLRSALSLVGPLLQASASKDDSTPTSGRVPTPSGASSS